MIQTAIELKPCPFCGWKEIYIEPDERGSGGQWVLPIHVGCCLCGVNIMCVDAETKDDAALVWNKRTDAALANTQGGVKVEELVWVKPPLSDTLSRCETELGTYRTWTHHEANSKWFWSLEGGRNEVQGEANTEEAAKAAAQQDYETRIPSAITLQGEPVGYMRKSAIKALKDTDTESFEGVHTMVSRYPNKYNTEPLYTAPTLAHQPVTAGLEKAKKKVDVTKEHPGMQMCSLHHKILVSSGEPNMWHCPDCKKNVRKPVDGRALDEEAVNQVLQLLEVYAPDTFTLEMAATIASAILSAITLGEPVGWEKAVQDIKDAMFQSGYYAGAKAGWNAHYDENPEKAYVELTKTSGHIGLLEAANATLAHQPVTAGWPDMDQLEAAEAYLRAYGSSKNAIAVHRAIEALAALKTEGRNDDRT